MNNSGTDTMIDIIQYQPQQKRHRASQNIQKTRGAIVLQKNIHGCKESQPTITSLYQHYIIQK